MAEIENVINELEEEKELCEEYFLKVDIFKDKSELEKLALKISTDGMQILDVAIQTIRELREDCNRYHEWGMHEGYEDAKEQIPKWHLCSEELPNDRQWYLAMFQEVDTEFIGLPYIADYLNGKHTKYTTDDGWIISNCTDREDSSSEYYKKLRCIAWMELPKFSEV